MKINRYIQFTIILPSSAFPLQNSRTYTLILLPANPIALKSRQAGHNTATDPT